MNTFEAAEIFLKEGIISYENYGITKRVPFKNIAQKYGIDEEIATNGVNHLFFLKLINIDSGGEYYLNPDRLDVVLGNNQNNTLSTIIFNTKTIIVKDNATYVQNINSSNFNQEFVKQIENEIPIEQRSMWKKIKNSPLFDIIITIAKRLADFE